MANLGASQCNLKAPRIFVDEGEILDKSLLPIKGKENIMEIRTAIKIYISTRNVPFVQTRQKAEILLKYHTFEGCFFHNFTSKPFTKFEFLYIVASALQS